MTTIEIVFIASINFLLIVNSVLMLLLLKIAKKGFAEVASSTDASAHTIEESNRRALETVKIQTKEAIDAYSQAVARMEQNRLLHSDNALKLVEHQTRSFLEAAQLVADNQKQLLEYAKKQSENQLATFLDAMDRATGSQRQLLEAARKQSENQLATFLDAMDRATGSQRQLLEAARKQSEDALLRAAEQHAQQIRAFSEATESTTAAQKQCLDNAKEQTDKVIKSLDKIRLSLEETIKF